MEGLSPREHGRVQMYVRFQGILLSLWKALLFPADQDGVCPAATWMGPQVSR